MLKTVIFDLGGTLLHYRDGENADFRNITRRGLCILRDDLLARGFAPPPEADFLAIVFEHIGAAYTTSLQELRGGSMEAAVRQALGAMGLAVDDGLWGDLRGPFNAVVDEIVFPREGVRETLAALHARGYRLGLLSNTFWAADVHDRHLKAHGLLDFLPVRVYSSGEVHIKPHPAIFQETLARMGVLAPEAIYVGDRLDADVIGAHRAGMRTALILSPYHDECIEDIEPDIIIGELPDLPDRLAAHGW